MRSVSALQPGWRSSLTLLGLFLVGMAGLSTGAVASVAEADAAVARGNELLAAGQAVEAKQAFEAALAEDPSSVEAHLGLARAYYALGEYSRAVLEFENVLRFDDLPPDAQSQAEVYDSVADEYIARGWAPFFYGETGIGNYRQNSSGSTDIFGGAGNYDTYLPIRVGGGWSICLCARSDPCTGDDRDMRDRQHRRDRRARLGARGFRAHLPGSDSLRRRSCRRIRADRRRRRGDPEPHRRRRCHGRGGCGRDP